MSTCRFCEIASFKTGRTMEYENKNVVVFKTVKPAATYHFLTVPKKHIKGFMDIKDEDSGIVSDMISAAQKVIKKHNIESGFRIAFNGGTYLQVHHLHMHIFAGTEEEMQNLFKDPDLVQSNDVGLY